MRPQIQMVDISLIFQPKDRLSAAFLSSPEIYSDERNTEGLACESLTRSNEAMFPLKSDLRPCQKRLWSELL